MADLFRCDKCKRIGKIDEKVGRLIVQEIGADGQPHPALFNRKLETCRTCLEELMGLVVRTTNIPEIDFSESNAIVRESRG